MKRKKLKILCLFICVLTLLPVSFSGHLQIALSDNESEQVFDEVRSPEEVRRAVESKPYNESIVEGRREGKSQIRTDLERLKGKAAEIRPQWLTKKVSLFIGTILLLGAVAIYVMNALKRQEKKQAMKKLKKIHDDAEKYR